MIEKPIIFNIAVLKHKNLLIFFYLLTFVGKTKSFFFHINLVSFGK